MSFVLCLCASVLFFSLAVCFLISTLYRSYRSRTWRGVLASLGLVALFPASLGVFLLGTLLLTCLDHFFSDTELTLLYGLLCSANLILPGIMAARGIRTNDRFRKLTDIFALITVILLMAASSFFMLFARACT